MLTGNHAREELLPPLCARARASPARRVRKKNWRALQSSTPCQAGAFRSCC